MSPRQEIDHLLGRWLELTQAEGCAIESASWSALGEIQSSKKGLQTSLTRAMRIWAEESGIPMPAAAGPFQKAVGHLQSLESRNALLLGAQIKRLKQRREKQVEGLRNLRRLRRSYAPRRDSGWESYS